MIFQDDDDLYRSRRRPWGTFLLSAFCFVLALAIVLGVWTRMKKARQNAEEEQTPPSVELPVLETPALPGTLPSSQPQPQPQPRPQSQPQSQPRPQPQSQPQPQSSQPITRPPARPSTPDSALLTERRSLMAKLAAASPADKPAIEASLGAVNVRLATTPVPSPHKVEHIIAAGDTLGKLANRYVCPISLIKKINGLHGNNIRAGQRLLILDHPQFAIEVSKSSNTLLLTLYGEFFKRYPVCTGAEGKTPSGTFEIIEKTDRPTWYPAGKAPIPYGQPGNILGTRWMRLEATGGTARINGIGIHGTTDDASIGTSASDGCIRMHNADVEEIYSLIPLNPHVPVTIRD